MKLLMISELNLMCSMVENIFIKYRCQVQCELPDLPRIAACMEAEHFELVLIHEDGVPGRLETLLAAVCPILDRQGGRYPRCLVIRGENHYDRAPSEVLKGCLLSGQAAVLLPKGLEQSLRHYYENLVLGTLPDHQRTTRLPSEITILVVDDSAVTREWLSQGLEGKGYRVLTAGGGEEGLRVFSAQRPHIVISDISMPEGTGYRLCERIKTVNSYAEVLLISSMNQEETIELAFASGADDFLLKPFKLRSLLEKVERVVARVIEKSKAKILVVDDDRFIRENLRVGFGNNHMEILTATNGMEGLAKALTELPDILITDIEMPSMDGYELLKAVKASACLEETTVIMMSGRFAPGKVKMMTRHAPIQFFSKPFDVHEMVRLTEQLVCTKAHQAHKEYTLLISGIMALIRALEAKDSYTRGHSERVTVFSLMAGSRLGLQGIQLKQLELAASLHDLGKIGVKDEVLLKPGRLTEEEFSAIREHPGVGADILDAIESLRFVARVVKHHHERYDGTGYPDGLMGTEIPLESRIIAVADTFDAVTSSRPYRRCPMSEGEAVELLRSVSGSQLCPDCVAAFLEELASDTLFSHDQFFDPRPQTFTFLDEKTEEPNGF